MHQVLPHIPKVPFGVLKIRNHIAKDIDCHLTEGELQNWSIAPCAVYIDHPGRTVFPLAGSGAELSTTQFQLYQQDILIFRALKQVWSKVMW